MWAGVPAGQAESGNCAWDLSMKYSLRSLPTTARNFLPQHSYIYFEDNNSVSTFYRPDICSRDAEL